MLKLKDMRIERKWSQRTLAAKIHSSQKSIDCWERGSSEPSARFITALCNCFGCSADYLLDREDEFGNVNINSDLSPDESALLTIYRSMKKERKAELSDYAKFLSELQ